MTLEENLSHGRMAKLKLLKNEIAGARLSPIETAYAINDFLGETKWTQLKLAMTMQYDAKIICAYMTLLKLPEDIQALVHEGEVTFWTAVEAQRADKTIQTDIFAKWRSGIKVHKDEIRDVKVKDRWKTIYEGKSKDEAMREIDQVGPGRKVKVMVLNG